MTLLSSDVDGVTCYWFRGPDGAKHGIIWPFGSTPTSAGVEVRSYGEIKIGQTVWVGGGFGPAGSSGTCQAGTTVQFGPFWASDPVPSGH